MSPAHGITLIVGGDGKVGRALANHLLRAGRPVVTTSRRPDPQSGSLFLDLSGDVESWPIPDGLSAAVLCAAVPLIAACEADPAGTARVNVAGALALIRRLVARGVFTVFCSTNQVFDGETPHVVPDAPQSPQTEYGRQKTQVERELIALGDRCAIVRFSKVLEPDPPLFARWRDALLAGETIEPFTDLCMAPIPLACAAMTLRLVAERSGGGIWQVSGDRDLTYVEAARILARSLDADPALIRPTSARAGGRVTAHLPKHTTLCVDRLRRELGVQPPSVEWTIGNALVHSEDS